MERVGVAVGGFTAQLPPGVRERVSAMEDLDAVVDAILAAGRERWPDLDLPVDAFLGQLAAMLAREPEPDQALRALNAADVYLACGCALGNPRALENFRRSYFPDVGAVVARMGAPSAVADDAMQIIGQKLFVAAPGAAPRICDYTGRGELRTWFRVVATRTVISLLRKGAREVPTSDDALLALRASGDDPRLAALRQRYRARFKAAFEASIAGLDARQRNLLRHQIVDGLSVDEIAGIYRVHRVTASRWLAAARKDIWLATRRRLSAQLGAGSAELRSLLRDLRSELDLSIARALRGSPPAGR